MTREQAEAVPVFKDEGFSGKDMDRPEFQCLKGEIDKGNVRLFIFASLSRVSRSVLDFLALVEELADRGVELRCIDESFDTTSAHGRLILTFLMALAQFEREQTAERTRKNMLARALRGLYNGGRCPLGYRPNPERKGYLDIVEEEAEIIRTIFDLFIEEGSVPKVTKRLAEAGIERPAMVSGRGTFHPARPIKWDAVRNILANPTYVGLKEINRNNRGLTKEESDALPKNERYSTVGAVWEPIVSREVWDRAAAIRERNRLTNGNSVKKRKRDFMLTGLVECNGCGERLHGATSKGGRYAYYQHQGPKQEGCAKARYPADPVEKTLLMRLRHLAEDEVLFGEVLEAANGRLLTALPQIEAEISRTQRQLTETESKAHRLAEFVMSGESVPAFFQEQAQRVQDEMDTAKRRLVRLKRERDGLEADRVDPEQYRAALRDLTGLMASMNREEKRRLLGYLVEKVALGDGGVTLYLRSETLEAPNVKHPEGTYPPGGKWLPLADSNCGPTD